MPAILEYDSSCDEFREVFEQEPPLDCLDENKHSESYSLVAIAENVRRWSSRNSVRKVKRNSHFISRIVRKHDGRLNTFLSKQPNKHFIAYFRDLGNTLLNVRWRWILITLFAVNFATFFILGLVWMWVAQASGDFEEGATDLCVVNVKHFAGYVLLSIETIITIGYGYRYPTEKCKLIWLVLASQAFISIVIQGALVSAIYVKISKPYTKDSMALFSRNAVICLRDGQLCLIIRIVDYFGKVSVGTAITMYYVDKDELNSNQSNSNVSIGSSCLDGSDKKRKSPDEDNKNSNGSGSLRMQQIAVQPYGLLMAVFPLEIVHVIDTTSPLWQMTAFEILRKRFEILVVVEGSSFVTGQLSQNRTSYVNTDILWGHRFSQCLELDEKTMKYVIRHKQLNKTIPFNTPLCSAEELSRIKEYFPENSENIDESSSDL